MSDADGLSPMPSGSATKHRTALSDSDADADTNDHSDSSPRSRKRAKLEHATGDKGKGKARVQDSDDDQERDPEDQEDEDVKGFIRDEDLGPDERQLLVRHNDGCVGLSLPKSEETLADSASGLSAQLRDGLDRPHCVPLVPHVRQRRVPPGPGPQHDHRAQRYGQVYNRVRHRHRTRLPRQGALPFSLSRRISGLRSLARTNVRRSSVARPSCRRTARTTRMRRRGSRLSSRASRARRTSSCAGTSRATQRRRDSSSMARTRRPRLSWSRWSSCRSRLATSGAPRLNLAPCFFLARPDRDPSPAPRTALSSRRTALRHLP